MLCFVLCSEFGQEYTSKATFDENLAFLKNMLATLHENCKTVRMGSVNELILQNGMPH